MWSRLCIIGGGTDEVRVLTDYTLNDHLENLVNNSATGRDLGGNNKANVITGNVGNDTLRGGGNSDTMIGGDGDDVYHVNKKGDVVTEGNGVDSGNDTVLSWADRWNANINVETILIQGDAGSRRDAKGNGADNTITGHDGNNLLDGGSGNDTLSGGLGNDTFIIDSADDVVDGGDGTDWVNSSAVSIDLSGGGNISNVEHAQLWNLTSTTANDLDLTGTNQNNKLKGNRGNNEINGGNGHDTMQGYAGDDTYHVQATGDRVLEARNGGTDTVIFTANGSNTGHTLANNVEILTLSTGAITGRGNGADNTINGNAEDNLIDGRGGADAMLGGAGNDTYIVNNNGDTVNDTGGTADLVKASVNTNLNTAAFVGVENLTLTGSAQNATGDGGDNVLTGNGRNNVLNGNAGADTMAGGRGHDTYVVDSDDTVTEQGGQGWDTVRADFTYALGANFEVLELQGSANIDGSGNGLKNRIEGNSGDNTLNGGGNNDTIDGGEGNDTLIGGAGNDIFRFTSSPTAGNADVISDFIAADDTIWLSKADFTGFASNGTLAATAFLSGAGANVATTADHRIIYNETSGQVFYDADGSAAGSSAVLVATLTGAPTIAHDDFVIIN